MNTFSNSTNKKLEALFRYLPEVFFWTVILTRLFIAVPLEIAAEKHFEFLKHPAVIVASAWVSVLIVESILTLPSLSTAFFKQFGFTRYQRVAFWTTILLGLFNQSLIILAYHDTDMSREAFYIYTVFNTASIVLAEFIGFMLQKPAVATVQANEPEWIDFTETSRTVSISSPKVREILELDLEQGEKIHKLAELGLSQRKIAPMFQMSASKANRVLNSWRNKNEISEEEHEEGQ